MKFNFKHTIFFIAVVLLVGVGSIFYFNQSVQTTVKSAVEVNYISTRDIKHYGELCIRRPFNISQTIIKNSDYTMQIYKDSISTKSIDTLILYRNGKITYKTVEGEKIDEKVVKIKNKNVLIQKIYFPHIGPESVDDF